MRWELGVVRACVCVRVCVCGGGGVGHKDRGCLVWTRLLHV
jgi:hypothetical protein